MNLCSSERDKCAEEESFTFKAEARTSQRHDVCAESGNPEQKPSVPDSRTKPNRTIIKGSWVQLGLQVILIVQEPSI